MNTTPGTSHLLSSSLTDPVLLQEETKLPSMCRTSNWNSFVFCFRCSSSYNGCSFNYSMVSVLSWQLPFLCQVKVLYRILLSQRRSKEERGKSYTLAWTGHDLRFEIVWNCLLSCVQYVNQSLLIAEIHQHSLTSGLTSTTLTWLRPSRPSHGLRFEIVWIYL